MSRSLGRTIGDGLKLSVGYAEQLLQGVTPELFGRVACPGGSVVHSNHPAFIYGHLALYPSRVVGFTGGEYPAAPDGFNELFAKGAECVDDPDGSVYPQMDVIRDVFFTGYRAVQDAIDAATDEVLSQSNSVGGIMAEKFPTTGSMCNFMCSGHLMIHLGQMSAWRRMQGLGPAS
ncbi:MAG: DinB family protein [Planctomycetaceae bacterium]